MFGLWPPLPQWLFAVTFGILLLLNVKIYSGEQPWCWGRWDDQQLSFMYLFTHAATFHIPRRALFQAFPRWVKTQIVGLEKLGTVNCFIGLLIIIKCFDVYLQGFGVADIGSLSYSYSLLFFSPSGATRTCLKFCLFKKSCPTSSLF